MKQSDEANTLIEEVNEKYSFWRPHQDEEYPVEERIVLPSTETTTTVSVIRTDIESTEGVSSNSNVVVVSAAATDDDDDDANLNAKLKLDDENSIGNLNGIQQEYSSHSNNYYDNIDANNPLSLPTVSVV